MPGILPAVLPQRLRSDLPSAIWVTDAALRTVSAIGAGLEELRAAERNHWPIARWRGKQNDVSEAFGILDRGGTIMFTGTLRTRTVDVYLVPHRTSDGRRGAIGMAFQAD